MLSTLEKSSAVRVVRRVAVGIVVAVCLGIVAIGARFLLDPGAAVAGFGVRTATDDPFLAIKGVRDIGSGVIILVVLATAGLRVLGATVLAAALIPLGDMIVVLTRGGPVATALGVHGATCLVMVAAAAALLLATRASTARPAPSTGDGVGWGGP